MVTSQNALQIHMDISVQKSVEYVKTIPRVTMKQASVWIAVRRDTLAKDA